DLTLTDRLAEQLHFVAFLDDLPRDVGDQAVERDEEELLLIQGCSSLASGCGKVRSILVKKQIPRYARVPRASLGMTSRPLFRKEGTKEISAEFGTIPQ